MSQATLTTNSPDPKLFAMMARRSNGSAKKRKNVPVAWVIKLGNDFLRHSENSLVNERRGVASLMSQILHDTGNYRGFNYLESANVRNAGTADLSIEDETRCYYYAPPV